MEQTNPVYTLVLLGSLLHKRQDSKEPGKSTQWRHLVGLLIYVSTCTRPDNDFLVGVLSHHIVTPFARHYGYFSKIVKFLKTTEPNLCQF
jgi:hypothetical protein